MFCRADERGLLVQNILSLLNPNPIEGEEGEAGGRMEDSGLTNALPTPRCPEYFSPNTCQGETFFEIKQLSITSNFQRVTIFIS